MAQLFYKLNLPQIDTTKKWFVRVERNDLVYYLLNDESHELADLDKTPVERFYFDTEFDAHVAACDYYTSHAKSYPYFDELNQSVYRQAMQTSKQTVDDNDNYSQVMTF